MARRSSSVSVGSPTMKYSLTCLHPYSRSFWTCSMISSSVMPLLMTSRRRWLPASGASVMPVRRMEDMRSMMLSSMDPTRREGREREICSSAQRSSVVEHSVLSAE